MPDEVDIIHLNARYKDIFVENYIRRVPNS